MKRMLLAAALAATAPQAGADENYKTCPNPETQKGIEVVRTACGEVIAPTFTPGTIHNLTALEAAQAERDGFKTRVDDYGTCITEFINMQRRPGADATSTAPDEAACAHAWAEDQVTQSVIDYGRTCIEFSNRSMKDTNIEPWSGACYPTITTAQN